MSTSGKLSMLEYVAMTPATLRRQIVGEYERPLAEALQRFGGRCVRIVASGSSYNAALITRHYLRRWLEREVLVTEPFSFCAYELPPCGDEFPFVVSQSGYSSNALSALDALRRCGRMAIGVTANPQSDFKDRAELLVDYGAGEETVGYVTMGVTALCFFLCLFALRTAHLEGRLDGDGWQAERAKLYRTVEAFVHLPHLPRIGILLFAVRCGVIVLHAAGPGAGAAGDFLELVLIDFHFFRHFIYPPSIVVRDSFSALWLSLLFPCTV